jgi:hypothetical protein
VIVIEVEEAEEEDSSLQVVTGSTYLLTGCPPSGDNTITEMSGVILEDEMRRENTVSTVGGWTISNEYVHTSPVETVE